MPSEYANLHRMLHTLSGHLLPFLSIEGHDNEVFGDLLSPAEHALLRTLSKDLGEKHKIQMSCSDHLVLSSLCRLSSSQHCDNIYPSTSFPAEDIQGGKRYLTKMNQLYVCPTYDPFLLSQLRR